MDKYRTGQESIIHINTSVFGGRVIKFAESKFAESELIFMTFNYFCDIHFHVNYGQLWLFFLFFFYLPQQQSS